MPKGFNATTGRKSTITNLGCYVCPNCHRIFTTKSYKLMVRYKQLHSKKCKVVLDNKPPSIKKNHLPTIFLAALCAFVNDEPPFIIFFIILICFVL